MARMASGTYPPPSSWLSAAHDRLGLLQVEKGRKNRIHLSWCNGSSIDDGFCKCSIKLGIVPITSGCTTRAVSIAPSIERTRSAAPELAANGRPLRTTPSAVELDIQAFRRDEDDVCFLTRYEAHMKQVYGRGGAFPSGSFAYNVMYLARKLKFN